MKDVKSIKLFYTTDGVSGNHIWYKGDIFGRFTDLKFHYEANSSVYNKAESFWLALMSYCQDNIISNNVNKESNW